MKKKYKIIVLLFFIVIIIGSVFNVYKNNKKNNSSLTIKKTNTLYKIKRSNNKYFLTKKNKKITIRDLFYDDKNIYIYFDGDKEGSILKYNIENNIIKVLYENDKNIVGNIKVFGKYYIINNSLYDKNFTKVDTNFSLSDDILSYDLKYKLIKNDKGIIKYNLETKKEEVLVSESNYYLLPNCFNKDNSIILLLEKSEDTKRVVYIDKKLVVHDIDISYDEDSTYQMLYNKYLLIRKENKSSVYDLELGEVVFDTDLDSIYYNSMVVYKKNNKVILKDYITSEERKLFNSNKNISNFISSSDYFSLLIKFKEDLNSFYIIYL